MELDQQTKSIAQAFRRFDAHGDGVIERSELIEAARNLNSDVWTVEKVKDLENAFTRCDGNGDDCINYEQFAAWFSAPEGLILADLNREMENFEEEQEKTESPKGRILPQISVMTVGGEEICQVERCDRMTGSRLKSCIEAKDGTPAAQQRLLGSEGVIGDDECIEAGDRVAVTLIRIPPAKQVFITGGRGEFVSVDDEDGIIKPGDPFRWSMAEVAPGEYTFQVSSGPHQGKYISALRGEASSTSKLQLTGFADTWAVDRGQCTSFHSWVFDGWPFAMGIRDATTTVGGGRCTYWQWQSNQYLLAEREQGQFQGDEAYWIELDNGSPAVVYNAQTGIQYVRKDRNTLGAHRA